MYVLQPHDIHINGVSHCEESQDFQVRIIVQSPQLLLLRLEMQLHVYITSIVAKPWTYNNRGIGGLFLFCAPLAQEGLAHCL